MKKMLTLKFLIHIYINITFRVCVCILTFLIVSQNHAYFLLIYLNCLSSLTKMNHLAGLQVSSSSSLSVYTHCGCEQLVRMYIPLSDKEAPQVITFCRFQGLGIKIRVLMSKSIPGQYCQQNFFRKILKQLGPMLCLGFCLTRESRYYVNFFRKKCNILALS